MAESEEYTTCIVPTCNKPLGHDTRELDYRVCHEHRLCSKCGGVLQPHEVRLAHELSLESDDSIDLAHPRCKVLTTSTINEDPTLSVKQSYYDYLNAIRLMVVPDMGLAISTNENNAMIHNARLVQEMDWDQKYAHLKMLEACVAQTSLAIAQDRKQLKERADAREAQNFKKAQLEAKTSSRPTQKPATDEGEILLAEFMKKNDIKDRKVALKLKRDRDKAIQALMAVGVPESAAQESVDKDLVKRGLLK